VLLIVGLVGYAGWVALPTGLEILQHPIVLIAAGIMFLVEFVADKIPASTRSGTESRPSFAFRPVRRLPPESSAGLDSAVWTTAAAILGGTLAHQPLHESGYPARLQTPRPEPFSNVALSVPRISAVGGCCGW